MRYEGSKYQRRLGRRVLLWRCSLGRGFVSVGVFGGIFGFLVLVFLGRMGRERDDGFFK